MRARFFYSQLHAIFGTFNSRFSVNVHVSGTVGNSHKVEQLSRNYRQFLFELCCRVRRLSSEIED